MQRKIYCILKMQKEDSKEEDSMYIPEFWCGVAITLFVEVVAMITFTVCDNFKKKKEDKGNE